MGCYIRVPYFRKPPYGHAGCMELLLKAGADKESFAAPTFKTASGTRRGHLPSARWSSSLKHSVRPSDAAGIWSFKSFAAPAVVARQVLVCAVVQKHRHNPDLCVPRYGSEHQKCVRPSCRTSKPSKAASISQFPATASCQLRTEKNITISCQLTGVEAYEHTFPAAATSLQPSCRLQRGHR